VASQVLRRMAAVPGRGEALLATAVLLLTAALAFAPLVTLLVLLAAAGVWTLVRVPYAIPLALIVLMGNVKVNWYLGFFTLFPEYLVLMVACGLGFIVWLQRPAWPPERRLVILFMVWIATGLLSVPFALSASKVLARVVLMGVSLVTLVSVLATVNTRPRLLRAVAVWEVVATLYAGFGIVQMVGMVVGFDTTPHFLEGIANPDMYLGVGSPVRRRIGDVFRANSMFNDPNILGGFLAAAMVAMLALRMHHAATGRRGRAAAELAALGVMAVCLLLTQSRSGFLALLAGSAVVFAHRPAALRRPGLWWALAACVVAMFGAAMLVGVDPTLLPSRFAGIGDVTDTSNRQHLEVFLYGLQLVARFPLTGVGLGNFGLYYGAERDAWFTNMMSHSAPLSAFAESGLPGGIAFLLLWVHVLRRIGRKPAEGDPQANTLYVALLASVVALLVANLFYDYLLRTFVWVIVGLALSAARLSAPAREPRGAA
jgi:hypothetical protein